MKCKFCDYEDRRLGNSFTKKISCRNCKREILEDGNISEPKEKKEKKVSTKAKKEVKVEVEEPKVEVEEPKVEEEPKEEPKEEKKNM